MIMDMKKRNIYANVALGPKRQKLFLIIYLKYEAFYQRVNKRLL